MNAVAENAVIVSDDGRTVRFHPRCPHCGKVAENTTSSTYCGQGVIANVGVFTCWQCKKTFSMRIIRR